MLVLVVAMLVATPTAALAGTGEDTDEQTDNEVEPGEQLSGVVAVQEEEFEGEMKERTFGVEVAQSATSDEAADVVADRLSEVEQRLGELEQRQDEIEQAHENGSMSDAEYAAAAAEVEAERASLERQVEAANRTAGSLPVDVLEENGINVSAIQTLKTSAEDLSGEEVARIAQSIAGEDVGQSMAENKRPFEIPANQGIGELPSQVPDDPVDGTDSTDSGDSTNSTDTDYDTGGSGNY